MIQIYKAVRLMPNLISGSGFEWYSDGILWFYFLKEQSNRKVFLLLGITRF